jgi:hypothetical protein
MINISPAILQYIFSEQSKSLFHTTSGAVNVYASRKKILKNVLSEKKRLKSLICCYGYKVRPSPIYLLIAVKYCTQGGTV